MSQIICGDSAEVLVEFDDNSIDCIATDPPYGIQFMGKEFDKALPPREIWSECLRVLKPGGVAFVMAIARTDCLWRVARDLEQAGFDISLQPILYCYNSGFPKALDIGKSFDKAAFRSWAKPLLDDMGWGNAELRKAVSAAVNGQYVPSDGANRKRGDEAFFDSGFDGQSKTNTEGTRLLTALVAKHWEPLEDLQKLDVWKDHSVLALREYQQQEFAIGPDHQDLSLPPGVRAKVGKSKDSANRSAGSWQAGEDTGGMAAGNEGERTVTAPSIDLAKQWDGYKSQTGLKPAYEFVIVARKPLDKSPIRDNVAEYGTGAYHIDAARVPFIDESEDTRRKPSTLKRGAIGYLRDDEPLLGGEGHSIGRFPPNLISSQDAMGEDNKYYDLDRWAEEHGFAEDETWLACAEAGLIRVPKPSKKEKEAGLDSTELIVLSLYKPTNNKEETQWESAGQKVRLLVDTEQSTPRVIGASTTMDANEWSTMLFGKKSTGQFPTDTASTISMETHSITKSETLNWLASSITNEYTVDANLETGNGGSLAPNVGRCSILVNTTIGETMASALGVRPVASKMLLQISAEGKPKANHPTTKPVALFAWLLALGCPKGGTVLDPFAGSGTTSVAAAKLGMDYILIDSDEHYCDIARARVAYAEQEVQQGRLL